MLFDEISKYLEQVNERYNYISEIELIGWF